MRRDYYAVLGIAATAGPREIRQSVPATRAAVLARRQLLGRAGARALRGDRRGLPGARRSRRARQMYDRFGSAAGADEALGDGRRGDDVHVVVELSFAEVVRGATRPARRAAVLAVRRLWGHRRRGGRAVRGVPGSRRAPRRRAGRRDGSRRSRLRRPDPCGAARATPARSAGPRGDLIVSTRVAEHPFFHAQGRQRALRRADQRVGGAAGRAHPGPDAVGTRRCSSCRRARRAGRCFACAVRALPRLTGESTRGPLRDRSRRGSDRARRADSTSWCASSSG